METKKVGRKRINQPAFDAISAAGKKEIVIMKKGWKLVTPPGAHILRKYLKREYKVSTLANGRGWVIKRVK